MFNVNVIQMSYVLHIYIFSGSNFYLMSFIQLINIQNTNTKTGEDIWNSAK